MDFSFSDLNFNSVENLPGFDARAAFTVNSASVSRKDVGIVPTIVDDLGAFSKLSSVAMGKIGCQDFYYRKRLCIFAGRKN